MGTLEIFLNRSDLSADVRETIRKEFFDRKRVEDDLRKHIQMIDFANDTIMIRSLDDRIVYWNQGASRLYGWTKEETLGQYVHTFLKTIFPEGLKKALKICFRKGFWSGELKHIKKDGSPIVVASRWTLQRDSKGNPIAFLEINHDITALKKAEKALREAHSQLEIRVEERTAELKTMNQKLEKLLKERKGLLKEILKISGLEQQRIGQDLHDGLSQHLTGIGFMGKVLERKLSKKLPAESSDAKKIVQLVNEAITQTRNLARGLYPVELGSGGLLAQLRELCTNTEKMFSIACHFEYGNEAQLKDSGKAMHLFCIAQEAVNNAVRHGQPKNICVTFLPLKNKVQLSIWDDGLGISKSQKKTTPGIGLRIMRYRSEMIGAILEIKQRPQGGTRVSCVFRDSLIKIRNEK